MLNQLETQKIDQMTVFDSITTENMQFTGEKDYFEKIVHSYIGEHTE